MPLWTSAFDNLTPVAVNDATNFTNSGYAALIGGTASLTLEHIEITVMGLSTTGNVQRMAFARDSVVGASSLSSSGKALNPINPNTPALGSPPVQFNTSTTKPQRAAAGWVLPIAMQTYGGIFRWRVPLGEGILQFGNAAYTGVGTGGEMSLSSISGVEPITFSDIFDIK